MCGSARPPLTSLTSRAPASRASSATDARMVSTLTGTPARASSVMTGRTRRTSSSAEIRCAPGRVDSPPTSTMSAPWTASSSPCATAASAPSHWPPSENESGVTLTTPMTRQRGSLGSPASRYSGGWGWGPLLMTQSLVSGRRLPAPDGALDPAAQPAQAHLPRYTARLQGRPDQERLGLEGGHRDAGRVLRLRENEKPGLPDRLELGVEFVQRLDLEPFGQEKQN